ncbi:MAG: hypothetical protein ISS79_00465 [Phycisphaerae bacterium]|nr:hypothetical protein [Phycisphaerae bacterium]
MLQRHQAKIEEADRAVAVYVACSYCPHRGGGNIFAGLYIFCEIASTGLLLAVRWGPIS